MPGLPSAKTPDRWSKAKAPWSRPPNGLGTATCRGNLSPAKCATPWFWIAATFDEPPVTRAGFNYIAIVS